MAESELKSIPPFLQRWPRWLRIVGAVFLFLTFAVASVGLLDQFAGRLGFWSCGNVPRAGDPWICSSVGRLTGTAIWIAITLPLGIWLGRFSQAMIFLPGPPISTDRAPQAARDSSFSTGTRRLAWGKRLVCGEVALRPGHPLACTVDSVDLTMTSRHSVDREWLRTGDLVEVVYQTVPGIPSLNLFLAFRVVGTPDVRGIGTRLHAISLPVMLACTIWFVGIEEPPMLIWATVSGLVAIIDITYLVLVHQAKHTLKALQVNGAGLHP